MQIVLVEPEIPPNTGNIARSCVMTAAKLHLIEPLGFSLDEKNLRRSGLDYWKYLNLEVHSDFSAFKRVKNPVGRLIAFSTQGKGYYHSMTYTNDDYLVFGCETKGLRPEILAQVDHILRIPMVEQIPRSLNLGNAVALVLYEALRQQGFPGMH